MLYFLVWGRKNKLGKMSKDLNTLQTTCSIPVKLFPIQSAFWREMAFGNMGLYLSLLDLCLHWASWIGSLLICMHVCVCLCLKLLVNWIFVSILQEDLWNPFQIWYYIIVKAYPFYLCRQKGHNGSHMRIKTSLPWCRVNWMDYTKRFNKCWGPGFPLSFAAEVLQKCSESII